MPTSPASDPARQGDPGPDVTSPESAASRPEPTPAGPTPQETITELQTELARSQDRHRRALADLDNYRKRMEREGDRRAAQGRRQQLLEWLEALDSVERALRMEPEDPGLTAVLQQMDAILARHGYVRLASPGDRFDPTRHEAIAVLPSATEPDQSILEVARSGFGEPDGEVLRTAQVVVAKRPAEG